VVSGSVEATEPATKAGASHKEIPRRHDALMVPSLRDRDRARSGDLTARRKSEATARSFR
jgi:hypothetical protein